MGRVVIQSQTFNCSPTTYAPASGTQIPAFYAVVQDASIRGQVKQPASTPEATFVGLTMEQSDKTGNVAVQLLGVAQAISDGSAVINPGDYLVVSGSATQSLSGRVKSQAIAAGDANVYNIIGRCVNRSQVAATAGLIVEVELNPQLVTAA
jgi:hypothetical protein